MTNLITSYPFRPWVLSAAAVLIASASAAPSHAQILVWPMEEIHDSIVTDDSEPSLPEEEPIKTLRLHPAAEPEPALRYKFWPVANEEMPGNAMTLIQRANVLRLEARASGRPDAFAENYELWMEAELDELPKEPVREYLEAHRRALAEVHRAAFMKDAEYDMGLEGLAGPEVIWLSLTEFQNTRDLARLLALEIRLAIAEQRYDDAIESLRAGFRLAEAVGQATDLLIGRLIGFALAGIMVGQAQELMTQPESPNLYWALASLPPSIWEIQEALEYEANMTGRMFPSLSDLPDSGAAEAVWQQRLVEATRDYLALGSLKENQDHTIQARLLAGMVVLGFSETARIYLQQIGYTSEEVAAMSPSEAVMRGTWERVRRIQDDFAKWALLPRTASEDYWREGEESLQMNGSVSEPATILLNLLMPAMQAAQSAGTRTEQSVAFLATIEAIRMHAAEHGQLPASLENLQPVPALRDPATGAMFTYERTSETEARLERAFASPGQPDTVVRLELVK